MLLSCNYVEVADCRYLKSRSLKVQGISQLNSAEVERLTQRKVKRSARRRPAVLKIVKQKYRLQEGHGYCQEEDGSEGTSRKYLHGWRSGAVKSACSNDNGCVAFAAGGNVGVLYTTTGAIHDTDNLRWQEDSTLITQGGYDEDSEAQWASARCSVKYGRPSYIIKQIEK